MTRAIFLVDSGPSVGLGHLSRSLLLLAALERKDVSCKLYTADPTAAQALGRQAAPMPARIADLPKADLIVCDSYRLTEDEYRALHRHARLAAALDDTAERPLPVDLVINHNLYAAQLDYAAISTAKVLAGPDYALVDERIMAAARRHRAEPPDNAVAISFGGTDDGTLAAGVASELLPRCDARIDVLMPASREPGAAIRTLLKAHPDRVKLHHGGDVPAILSRAKVYAGAAGMMSFEAFAIGLYLVVSPIAENQRPGAEALLRYGHEMTPRFDAARLAELAAQRLRHPPLITLSPIDGHGPDRLAAALLHELAGRAEPRSGPV